MSEQKRFKQFRSELNESEYKETLTGYPNRGIDTDVGGVKHDADTIQKINGVLAALGRYTYQHTAEAMIKIRTRLNLFMIDFPWTPWMWQSNPTGTFTLNATLFGRVDGVDGMSGNIRFDGKANPNAGMKEFALVVTVEPAEDGFYRVNAKLQPQIAVMPEGVEHDGDTIEEDLQTPARQRDMEHAIQRAEDKASRGYEAKMTKTGKAAARGRKQEAKYDAAARRLIKKDQKEYSSLRKTYGRGGKPVKEATEPIEEDLQTPERFRQVTREQEKLRSEFEKRFEKLYKKGARERYSKKLYGKDGKVVKGKRKPVKEEAEQIEEMLKAGDKVKVPHKGKMVRGRIVRHDSGGSGKAQQHGGGYVVDVGEYGSITVPGHKVVKEAASGFSRKTLDSYIAKRGSQLSSMLSGHTRGKQLTGKQQANAVKGIKAAMAAKTTNEEVVDEALIGGQKKLDVNKNKRLDSQDFAMLRAKKKPVQEQEQKKPWWMTSTAAELAAAAQSASDARKGEEAEKRKRHAQQNRRMKWTLADKAQGKKTVKEAAMGKPKKMIPVTKTKDGKKVSTKLIPAYTPKKAVNEYTEMMGGIPLTTPDPTIAMADKSGKGKRFHKGAIKSVAEAVAKGKKAKKPSTHQGAANVIGKQKAIKSRLEKHDMRW
jgi:hypothetical protein